METLKKWYVYVAVFCFTVGFPVYGRTPLQWGLHGFQVVAGTVNAQQR